MSEISEKLILTLSLIIVSMLCGYLLRRTRFPADRVAGWIMTFVGVAGYSVVGFLTIWQLRPAGSAFWLPVLATAHVAILCGLGLALAKTLLKERPLQGLLSIASGAGNNGFTMGGFVIYLLFGEAGLGLVTVYGLAWTPTTVLIFYPIARHFAQDGPRQPLGMLMLRSIFDWRSVGLPVTLAGLALGYADVPRPAAIADYHVIDALVFTITPLAYFAIGLRLHASDLAAGRKMIAALAGLRFVAGPLVGLILVGLAALGPWPMNRLDRSVFLIEAFVPTAVTMVVVSSLFSLEPRRASLLFIVNTLMYLVIVLPITLWLFG